MGSEPEPMGRALRLFLVAGEPSGDQLGARLISALRMMDAGRGGPGIVFAGIGGPLMQAEGLVSLFPMRDLAVMGLVEVLPHLRRLARRLDEAEAAVNAFAPDGMITIDSPGFTLRLARRVRAAHRNKVRLIHYVAPTVWAWKPERAPRLAALYDQLLVLLPFEPPWFTAHNLVTDFVGHPAIERPEAPWSGAAFRAAHGIADTVPVLALLPGSRRGEVKRHLPPFMDAARRLSERHAGLHVVAPTVEGLEAMLAAGLASAGLPATCGVFGAAEKAGAFAAANIALAASGTVSTELAAARVPHVVAYRVNPLTYRLLRRLVRVPYVTVANLVLNRPAIPELLQERCEATGLAEALDILLRDESARARQLEAQAAAMALLGEGAAQSPSQRAAEAVLRGFPATAAPPSRSA